MFELAKSEYIRYQKWALLAAFIVLALLGLVSKFKPLLEASNAQSALVNLLFLSASLIFGLVQMALYKRKNHWTYLIHRPLALHKIYFAICAAALVLLSLAFALPWLLSMVGIDLFSETVVESRHYLHIAFLFLTCVLCYLIGSLMVLNPSFAIAGLLILLTFALAPNAKNMLAQFLPLLIFIAIVLYLNVKSFKADLSTYLTQPLSVVLLAIPLSFAFLYALTAGGTTMVYHLPKFIAGTHPDHNPVENTLRYIWQHDAGDMPAYILANTDTALAKNLIQQAKLAKHDWLDPENQPFPRKGQLYVDDYQYALKDNSNNGMWQFSHKHMVLMGTASTTKQPIGLLGKKGFVSSIAALKPEDKFKQVPVLLGEQFLMTQKVIYQVNFADQQLTEKLVLSESEKFINLPQFYDNFIAVTTNKNILIFDPRTYRDEYQTITADYQIPHPVAVTSLYSVRAYQLADGYMLAYFGPDHFGYDRPGAQIFYAKLSGEVQYVGGREFTTYTHPAYIREGLYVISPVLWAAQSLMLNLIDPDMGLAKPLADIRKINIAYQANVAAIVLHVISVLGAMLMAYRHRWSAPLCATWISLCLFLSLPALVACVLLNPLRVENKKLVQQV